VAAIAVGLHFQDDRTVSFARPGDGLDAGGMDGFDVHSFHGFTRNVMRDATLIEVNFRVERRSEVPMAYWLFSMT